MQTSALTTGSYTSLMACQPLPAASSLGTLQRQKSAIESHTSQSPRSTESGRSCVVQSQTGGGEKRLQERPSGPKSETTCAADGALCSMPRPSVFKSALLTNVLSASFFLFPLTGRGLEGGLLMQENKMVYELKPFIESSPHRMSAIGGDALFMGKTSSQFSLTWG